MRTCVIYNPNSGRGRAAARIEELRRHAGGAVEVLATAWPGHAEELAASAVRDGFGRIIAAGGDGTIHEVANGLLRSHNPEIVLAIWPCGSANDYAHTLGITGEPQQPTEVQAVDVGRIESPDGRERFFLNGMGIGFNGAVTAEARKIRWLRGMPLYALAVFATMVRHFDKPEMTLRFDDAVRQTPTLALTLNLGKREGGFPITSKADLCDGLFDYMHAGPVSRYDLLRQFPNLIRGTLPANHPRLWLGQCRHLKVESQAPLLIHLDGEFFAQSENNVRSISVELLPLRLRVERGLLPANR